MNLIKIISISCLISGFLFANVNNGVVNKNNKELKRGMKHIPLSKAFLSHENGGDSYASVALSDGIGIYSTTESDYSKTIAELNAKYGEEAEKAGETLKDYVKEKGTPEEKDLVDDFVYAVPNKSAIGAPCDDGDPKTGNDMYIDVDFTCVGERIYAYADKIEKIEYADKFLQTVYNNKIDSFEYTEKVNNTYYQNKTTYTVYGACPTGYVSQDTTQCREEFTYANKVNSTSTVAASGSVECVRSGYNQQVIFASSSGDLGSGYYNFCLAKAKNNIFLDAPYLANPPSNKIMVANAGVRPIPSGPVIGIIYLWAIPSYTCPSGYTLSGSTCTIITTSCPSGYSDYGNATQCRKDGTELVNKPTSIGYDACVSPWVNHDSTQCKQVKAECTTGYNDNGTNCVKTIKVCPSDMVEHSTTECKKDAMVCPSDYQDIGINCSKSTMICPDGYEDMGSNCRI